MRAFFIKAIDELFVKDKPIEFNNNLTYAKSESEVLELLRLCFWIERSKHTITTFNNKLSEVKVQLELGGQKRLGEKFAKKSDIISRILLHPLISKYEKDLHRICFLKTSIFLEFGMF